jgi:hypothetical protein
VSTLVANLYLTLEEADNRPWIVWKDIRLTRTMIVGKDNRPNLTSTDIRSPAADAEQPASLVWAASLHNQGTLFLHTVDTVHSWYCTHTIINIWVKNKKYLTFAFLAPLTTMGA